MPERIQVEAREPNHLRCPYCHSAPEGAVVACRECGAEHHAECFEEYGRCSAGHCGSRAARQVSGAPSAPHLGDRAQEALDRDLSHRVTPALCVVLTCVTSLGSLLLLLWERAGLEPRLAVYRRAGTRGALLVHDQLIAQWLHGHVFPCLALLALLYGGAHLAARARSTRRWWTASCALSGLAWLALLSLLLGAA